MDYDTEAHVQVLLQAVHAIAFLALAVWFVRQSPRVRWATLGAVGAGLLAVSFGILSASSIENVFLEQAEIALNLLFRDYVYTALFVAQAAGAVLLVLAFVESRRTPSTGTGSIYGS